MEEFMIGQVIRIDDSSRVGEARRLAVSIAEREGVSDSGRVAIVASELATNLQKHSVGGAFHVAPLSGRGEPGIEMVAIDHGPGMRNLGEYFVDGHSTTGTAGTGLGAIRRLSDELDAHSEPERGTILVSRILARPEAVRPAAQGRKFAVGLIQRPIATEEVCGDAWSIRFEGRSVLMMVADGLGHGVSAAAASGMAVQTFQGMSEEGPAAMVETIHRALRGTRGAAVAVARLDFDDARLVYCGVGNIVGNVLTPAKSWAMVSHNGTVGHQIRHTQEFIYPLAEESVVVMHSDGLSGNWNLNGNLNGNAGILRRDPSIIAALLYRQAARDRDDACVIVGKRQ